MTAVSYAMSCADKVRKANTAISEQQQLAAKMASKSVAISLNCKDLIQISKDHEVIINNEKCDLCEKKVTRIAVDARIMTQTQQKNKSSLCIISKAQWAITYNKYDLLQKLIKNNSNLIHQHLDFYTNKEIINTTLINYAISIGNLAAVKYLIKQGANVNLADQAGYTPLDKATYSAEITAYLLTQKANPQRVNDHINSSSSALGTAIYTGNVETVKVILDFNKDLLHQPCYSGFKPLDLANQLDSTAATPLEKAEIVSYIFNLANKGKIKLPKGHLHSPSSLHTVCKSNNLDYIKNVLKHAKKSLTKLEFANYLNQSYRGTTALHLACSTEDTQIIKYLLKNGADIYKLDFKELTALDILLKQKSSTENLKLVIDKIDKKDLDKPLFNGFSAMGLALRYSNENLSRLLLSKRIDLYEKYIESCNTSLMNDAPAIEPATRSSVKKLSFANESTIAKIVEDLTEEKEVKILTISGMLNDNPKYIMCKQEKKRLLELSLEEY